MSQNMKNRYRVFRRGWGTYYCEDLRTGKQEEMHRHTQPQLALGQEPRWQGRDVDPAAATTTRVLRAHRPAHHHLGRHVVEFFAGFLADTLRGLSAVGARIERFGLHDEGLTFQVFGQRVAAPTSSSFGRVSQLLRWLVLQDIVAGGRGALGLALRGGGGAPGVFVVWACPPAARCVAPQGLGGGGGGRWGAARGGGGGLGRPPPTSPAR